jgi:hypothetical protein
MLISFNCHDRAHLGIWFKRRGLLVGKMSKALIARVWRMVFGRKVLISRAWKTNSGSATIFTVPGVISLVWRPMTNIHPRS